jgi:hypothetical protein
VTRYFAQPKRPKAVYDDWNPMLPSLSVDDHVPVDTGLVNHRGEPIMRAPNPIGFGRAA